MEEQAQKIILYKGYDTAMDANLAKTKLDAYGIPCFLTDEHFVNMYPIRNEVFPGARLFIFESDLTYVNEIMQPEAVSDHEATHCPNCQSANISLKNKQVPGALRGIISALTSSLFAYAAPNNTYKYCNDCKNEWI